jgi:hypothetical protein
MYQDREAVGVSQAAGGTEICHTLDGASSGLPRRALFPSMLVRVSAPEAGITASSSRGDVEIERAGLTVTYRDVPFQVPPASMGTRVRE